MQPVLHSFAYCIDYLCDQVADVPADDMAAQPAGVANHPAWVIGHVTYSCQMVGGEIGLPAWLPEGWAACYGPGSVPVADAAAYEPKEQALARLRDARDRITRAVERLAEVQLDAPLPDPAHRDVFPTIRRALTHVLTAHVGYHVGQVSAWRRAMRLPRMARAFE